MPVREDPREQLQLFDHLAELPAAVLEDQRLRVREAVEILEGTVPHESRQVRKEGFDVNPAIRALVAETKLSPDDFIVPLFVVEGTGIREPIASMPGYFRFSIDVLEKEVKELWSMGLKSVLLFIKCRDDLKDNKGTEAVNPDGLLPRSIKAVKSAVPGMVVMTDVALDPFSSYGHDGIVKDPLQDISPNPLLLQSCNFSVYFQYWS